MVLLLIQRAEGIRRQSRKIVIRQVIRHRNTFDDHAPKMLTLRFRKLLELAKNLGDCSCHALSIHGPPELSKGEPANEVIVQAP